MDTLTHALSGALLARATASEEPRAIPRRIAAGFFACAAPDLDFVFGYAGPVEYLLNHRGITHSLVLLPLWALGLSWLLAKILREPRGWRALYGISALAIAAHIAGDVITSYGTMVLAPLSDWRAAIGTTRSEEHTSELQSQSNLVCRLLLEKKKKNNNNKNNE